MSEHRKMVCVELGKQPSRWIGDGCGGHTVASVGVVQGCPGLAFLAEGVDM